MSTNTVPSKSTSTFPETDTTRYKLTFFTPPLSLPAIKTALFALGAGRIHSSSKYSEVCFTTPGIGQFRPGVGAVPTIGTAPATGTDGQATGGQLEEVGEVRCEMLVVGKERVRECVRVAREVHPYEEAVVEVVKLEDF